MRDVVGTGISITDEPYSFLGGYISSGFYTSTFVFDSPSVITVSDIYACVFDFVPGNSGVPTRIYSSFRLINSPLSSGSYRYTVAFSYYIPSNISSVGGACYLYFTKPFEISYFGLSSGLNSQGIILDEADAIYSLTSYFMMQQDTNDRNYSAAVPNGLGQQQQEAQNQLTDYETKEQAVFDNLNTSLDGLNLNQYTSFNPGLSSSFVFINRYVTSGFDGLGDFKIILFLPMVVGISLSVIGRMGAMMSRIDVRDRRNAAQAEKVAWRNYWANRRRR